MREKSHVELKISPLQFLFVGMRIPSVSSTISCQSPRLGGKEMINFGLKLSPWYVSLGATKICWTTIS